MPLLLGTGASFARAGPGPPQSEHMQKLRPCACRRVQAFLLALRRALGGVAAQLAAGRLGRERRQRGGHDLTGSGEAVRT